jgi:hypothetical protein
MEMRHHRKKSQVDDRYIRRQIRHDRNKPEIFPIPNNRKFRHGP